MDETLKRKLFLHYWGALEGEELREVERILEDPAVRDAYDKMTAAIKSTFVETPASKKDEPAIASFQDIKRVYHERVERKAARTEQLMTLTWLGVTTLAVFVILFLAVMFVSSPRYRESLAFIGLDRTIEIVQVEGDVTLFDAHGREIAIKNDAVEIAKDDRIVTGPLGSAQVRFGQELYLWLSPSTRAQILSTRIDTDLFSANVTLEEGSLQFETMNGRRASKPFFIETDRLRVEGTTGVFLIAKYPESERFNVIRGRLVARPIINSISNAASGVVPISPLHALNRTEFYFAERAVGFFPETFVIEDPVVFERASKDALNVSEAHEVLLDYFNGE